MCQSIPSCYERSTHPFLRIRSRSRYWISRNAYASSSEIKSYVKNLCEEYFYDIKGFITDAKKDFKKIIELIQHQDSTVREINMMYKNFYEKLFRAFNIEV